MLCCCHAPRLQVSRLQREVEGLEEQRARAREDAKRSELARQQLEQEIKVCTIAADLTQHRTSVISCACCVTAACA
jgi:hypothetical protein